MSARAGKLGKLGAVGLGALTWACAGMQLPSGPMTVGEALGTMSTVVKSALSVSKCEELRAKVSFDEERSLGGAVALKWVQGGHGLMLANKSEKDLQQYVNVVGKNLAAQSSRPTLPWTFGVLKDAQAFNAASAPGGYVFVTRGLLKSVENEAQLAGVLAHEIAHVTLQHALTRYDDVKVSQCSTAARIQAGQEIAESLGAKLTPDMLDAFVDAVEGSGALDLDNHSGLLGVLVDDLSEKLVTDGYASEDEYAADAEAARLLLSAGYEPGEYVHFLGKLPESGNSFAHHPRKAQRQEKVLRVVAAEQKAHEGEFSSAPADGKGLQKPELPPEFAIARTAK